MSHGNRPRENSGIAPETAAADIRTIGRSGRAPHRSEAQFFSPADAILTWAKANHRPLTNDEWLGQFEPGGMEHDIWFHWVFLRVGPECAYVHPHQTLAVFDPHLGNYLRGETGQIFAIDVIPGRCGPRVWAELKQMAGLSP